MTAMSPAEIRAFVVRLKEEIINRHDPTAADRFFAPDFVTRGEIPGGKAGLQGAKGGFGDFFEAFPDVHETVEEVIVEGDRVTERGTARATHLGPVLGLAASGRRVTLATFETWRLAEGRIKELFFTLDGLAVLLQIGALPAPPQSQARCGPWRNGRPRSRQLARSTL